MAKISRYDGKILRFDGKLVNFKPREYDVTIVQPSHGTISSDKSRAPHGATVNLSNTPDTDYRILNYTLDGSVIQGISFSMPAHGVIVSGAFERYLYSINITQPTGATIASNKSKAEVGETVTLSITTQTGYGLQYYTVNGSQIVGNTFTMPEGDVTISAVLEDTSWKRQVYEREAEASSSNSPISINYNYSDGDYLVYDFDVKTPTIFIGNQIYTNDGSGYYPPGTRIESDSLCRYAIRYRSGSISTFWTVYYFRNLVLRESCYTEGLYPDDFSVGFIKKSGLWGSDWHHVRIVEHCYSDPEAISTYLYDYEFIIDGTVMFYATRSYTSSLFGFNLLYLENSTRMKNLDIFLTSVRARAWQEV